MSQQKTHADVKHIIIHARPKKSTSLPARGQKLRCANTCCAATRCLTGTEKFTQSHHSTALGHAERLRRRATSPKSQRVRGRARCPREGPRGQQATRAPRVVELIILVVAGSSAGPGRTVVRGDCCVGFVVGCIA